MTIWERCFETELNNDSSCPKNLERAFLGMKLGVCKLPGVTGKGAEDSAEKQK